MSCIKLEASAVSCLFVFVIVNVCHKPGRLNFMGVYNVETDRGDKEANLVARSVGFPAFWKSRDVFLEGRAKKQRQF